MWIQPCLRNLNSFLPAPSWELLKCLGRICVLPQPSVGCFLVLKEVQNASWNKSLSILSRVLLLMSIPVLSVKVSGKESTGRCRFYLWQGLLGKLIHHARPCVLFISLLNFSPFVLTHLTILLFPFHQGCKLVPVFSRKGHNFLELFHLGFFVSLRVRWV